MQARIAFLLAPGAGASTKHPRMRAFADLLTPLGPVYPFDYPYMRQGKGRPDRLPTLIAAHCKSLDDARHISGTPVVLIGKSMGRREGSMCHWKSRFRP